MFGHLTNGIYYCTVLLNFIDHNLRLFYRKHMFSCVGGIELLVLVQNTLTMQLKLWF